jgi:addiction module HigA family antidote
MPMKNPPHPGRGLKADFDELGLTTATAAQALGVSRSQVHRVVAGESAITAELALRLEIVIGSTAEQWLQMQAAYDAAQVRNRAGEITKGLKRITAAPTPAQPSLL